MKAISGRELARLFEKHGWLLLRRCGSHNIYGKPGHKARLSIPIHGNKPLKRGLVKHLLKIAGLAEDDVGV